MIIPIYDLALLPNMHYVLKIKNINKEELHDRVENGEKIVALPMKNKKLPPLNAQDFYKIGALLHVDEIKNVSDGVSVSIVVVNFAQVSNLEYDGSHLTGEVKIIEDNIDIDSTEQNEMLNYIKNISNDLASRMTNVDEVLKMLNEFNDLNKLMGFVTQGMNISSTEKYKLMETISLKERTLIFIDYLLRFKEALQVQIELAEHFSEKANKNYREAALREQLRIIQEELNENQTSGDKKKKDYRTRVEESAMPDDIKSAVLEEVDKFESQQPSSADYNVIRNYLDFVLDLPWSADDEDENISITEARRVLNENHYGLNKVKERIIQHLAVMQLRKNKKGSILLLVGPPGTGKTSLGKSIAEALNREYVRISLGGVRDEAQIRGHRRTYVGALPGRILKAMKDAGTVNPVMVLDEVDKLMVAYSGDPASALLEVLDPEQNNTFTDNYLDLPYDLSNVFFVTTANSIENIPAPLLDRMEVIHISSYTATEKFHIAKEHLIRKSLDEHGLTKEDIQIEDETLKKIIAEYTMEAGVRGLKKQIDTLSRVTAEKVIENADERPFIIKPDDLADMLGSKISRHEIAQEQNPPGVVTGLAWTPVGGEILFIEATDIPGKGGITLTGKLGDVMQESAKIALSLLKSRLPVNAVSFKDKDIHIHVPSGAVPKDGPSAGIALFSSLASLVTGIPVNGKIAMTGEVSLRGVVMPIGGLKEKLIAAHRAGITKALIPVDNEIDLKEVPDEVKADLEITPVETIEDVLRETLNIRLPKIDAVSWANQDDKNKYFLPK
ncbi:MAG: endopeptidase La [Clostridia bacterium]|nr:endopeptidase La [Clostridia bacterium]